MGIEIDGNVSPRQLEEGEGAPTRERVGKLRANDDESYLGKEGSFRSRTSRKRATSKIATAGPSFSSSSSLADSFSQLDNTSSETPTGDCDLQKSENRQKSLLGLQSMSFDVKKESTREKEMKKEGFGFLRKSTLAISEKTKKSKLSYSLLSLSRKDVDGEFEVGEDGKKALGGKAEQWLRSKDFQLTSTHSPFITLSHTFLTFSFALSFQPRIVKKQPPYSTHGKKKENQAPNSRGNYFALAQRAIYTQSDI